MSENYYGRFRWLPQSLVNRWSDYWFGCSSASNLAVCRILACSLFCIYFLFRREHWGYPQLKEVYWEATFLYYKFDLPVFSSDTVWLIQLVCTVCLALAALGLLTRTSLTGATITATYLASLPHNFGKTYHFTICIPFILIALWAAPCSDALSFDRLIAKRKHRVPTAASGAYRWPVRFVWLLFAILFFAAGLSKLRHGGLAWMSDENMSNILRTVHYGSSPPLDWGLAIADVPWLSQSFAIATVCFELFAPLALVSRLARVIIVPGLFGMLIGFYLLLGILPFAFFAMFVFWVPWDSVGAMFSSFGLRGNKGG